LKIHSRRELLLGKVIEAGQKKIEGSAWERCELVSWKNQLVEEVTAERRRTDWVWFPKESIAGEPSFFCREEFVQKGRGSAFFPKEGGKKSAGSRRETSLLKWGGLCERTPQQTLPSVIPMVLGGEPLGGKKYDSAKFQAAKSSRKTGGQPMEGAPFGEKC